MNDEQDIEAVEHEPKPRRSLAVLSHLMVALAGLALIALPIVLGYLLAEEHERSDYWRGQFIEYCIEDAGCDAHVELQEVLAPVAEPVTAIPGEQGPPGPPGATGATGRPGVDGEDGDDGAPGQPGTPGEAGAAGEPGVDGASGTDGTPGPAGAAGPAGEPGAPGAPGAPGVDGKDGRGIAALSCSSATPLAIDITYTDGTTQTVTCGQPSETPAPTAPPEEAAP